MDDSGDDMNDWNCKNCSVKVTGHFDVCWNCGSDRFGNRDRQFSATQDDSSLESADRDADGGPTPSQIQENFACPKCGGDSAQVDEIYARSISALQGKRFYYAISCQRCGFTEFFNSSILEQRTGVQDFFRSIFNP